MSKYSKTCRTMNEEEDNDLTPSLHFQLVSQIENQKNTK